MTKSSSNDLKHPYMRGYSFWKDNAFWRSGMYSKKTQEYYESRLLEMKNGDPLNLIRLNNAK